MKKQQVQHTASLSVPSDFIDTPYSSALLLDGRLDASITDDPAFHTSCKWGFDGYFADMLLPGPGRVYEDCFYTVGEVRKEVIVDVLVGYKQDKTPLATCVGVALGWLSALALSQYQEAKEGLEELYLLIDRVGVE